MAFQNGRPSARCRNDERRGVDREAMQCAENLGSLFARPFLPRRECRARRCRGCRARRLRRASRSGDALHRGHRDLLDTELSMQRGERDRQAGGRAIRDRRDEALPATAFALRAQERGVAQVDSRNQERHVVFVTIGGGGAEHGSELGPARLELARGLALDGREHDVDRRGIEIGAGNHRQTKDVGRRRLAAPPADGTGLGVPQRVAERFPCRALGCRQGGHLEPRMITKRVDELLAGDAGRADDRDAQLFGGRHENLLGRAAVSRASVTVTGAERFPRSGRVL